MILRISMRLSSRQQGLGCAGVFSRFGLGTEFPSDWPGRYNTTDAEIQTSHSILTLP